MKITVCEFPDAVEEAKSAWNWLSLSLTAEATDLLLLPELVGVGSFWTRKAFDPAVWANAVKEHESLPNLLERLPARRILGTRAVNRDGKRLNESFLWTNEHQLKPGRAKAWLPNEEESWEAE